MDLLRAHPPSDVTYSSVGGFHTGGPGASCARVREVALNRLVHPRTNPDMGFRALRLRDRFDLVHVHAHPVHLARLRGAPVAMSEGSSNAVYLGAYLGWDDERMERVYRRTRRLYRARGIRDRLLALKAVDRVYVFSEWAREVNLRWGADPAKLDVVSPGFPVPEPVERAEGETFTFLFVGTDFERKGGFDVVEAFSQICGDYPHARLVMIGSDPWTPNPDRSLHAWVSDDRRRRVLAQLSELERVGLARHEALVEADALQRSLYPGADAFVMPTLAEGWGFTNVEAMSYGLPVISSRVGPIPETVDHGRLGLLVDPGDVDGLAAAMAQLVSDPARARLMGQQARYEFLERHTIDGVRVRLANFYRRVLERVQA